MENQNTHYVLAFDFGASSGRAFLGALKDGKNRDERDPPLFE